MNTTKRSFGAGMILLVLTSLIPAVALPAFTPDASARAGQLDAAERTEARRIILYRAPSGEVIETNTDDA